MPGISYILELANLCRLDPRTVYLCHLESLIGNIKIPALSVAIKNGNWQLFWFVPSVLVQLSPREGVLQCSLTLCVHGKFLCIQLAQVYCIRYKS